MLGFGGFLNLHNGSGADFNKIAKVWNLLVDNRPVETLAQVHKEARIKCLFQKKKCLFQHSNNENGKLFESGDY